MTQTTTYAPTIPTNRRQSSYVTGKRQGFCKSRSFGLLNHFDHTNQLYGKQKVKRHRKYNRCGGSGGGGGGGGGGGIGVEL
ncbi:Hypothetical predicted protein [Octopus vulgaris]|uniref:Uncharacterized protein n=1 Tax=Octopus vulgaris TaxID=6645 RepID=A0AA36BRJ5_OCTVU|nr:Hypothetical predicted protein [Octopus vulgaris]